MITVKIVNALFSSLVPLLILPVLNYLVMVVVWFGFGFFRLSRN